MSNLDAELMAERLGLTEPLIRQLQARGYFERLAIDEDELRTRLSAAISAGSSKTRAQQLVRPEPSRVIVDRARDDDLVGARLGHERLEPLTNSFR